MKAEAIFDKHNKEKKRKVGGIGISGESPPRLPSGIFQFDLATGGGIPRGRISVIYGPESAMKTTLCLKLIAQAQKRYPDERAVFIDVEGHFDPEWAKVMGVDVDKLGYCLPSSAEETIDVAESLLYADDLSLIVVDSLAAMVPEDELERGAGDSLVGRAGIAINKFYRKTGRALGVAKEKGLMPTMICINQIRYKIGVLHGDPETMPGGPSFKFASSMTIRVYGKDEMVAEVHPGLPAYKKVTAVIKKNKVPITCKNCEFLIALRPIAKYGLAVGDVYDWNTVLRYLKELNLLVKQASGWGLVWADTGEIEVFDKQDDIKDKMFADAEFNLRVKDMIVAGVIDYEGVIVGES